jgi:hypothetical protein
LRRDTRLNQHRGGEEVQCSHYRSA